MIVGIHVTARDVQKHVVENHLHSSGVDYTTFEAALCLDWRSKRDSSVQRLVFDTLDKDSGRRIRLYDADATASVESADELSFNASKEISIGFKEFKELASGGAKWRNFSLYPPTSDSFYKLASEVEEVPEPVPHGMFGPSPKNDAKELHSKVPEDIAVVLIFIVCYNFYFFMRISIDMYSSRVIMET